MSMLCTQIFPLIFKIPIDRRNVALVLGSGYGRVGLPLFEGRFRTVRLVELDIRKLAWTPPPRYDSNLELVWGDFTDERLANFGRVDMIPGAI